MSACLCWAWSDAYARGERCKACGRLVWPPKRALPCIATALALTVLAVGSRVAWDLVRWC